MEQPQWEVPARERGDYGGGYVSMTPRLYTFSDGDMEFWRKEAGHTGISDCLVSICCP